MNKKRFRAFEREAKKIRKNLQRKLRVHKKEMNRLLKELNSFARDTDNVKKTRQ